MRKTEQHRMGLLSNPSLNPNNKVGRNLAKFMRMISIFFYFAGIAWFILLALTDWNHSTYLSENALSPGLVLPEIKQDSARLAQTLLEELQRERDTHKTATPHAWILAKMKQIGLEVHVHNFTLKYPFGGGRVFYGRNVYGIVRAPRIGSTEGIVFSAPYRPPGSVHTDIAASVPLLLAFADFARKKNYWAKDIIFLVTEQEQLGMQAWMEAYHLGGMNTDTTYLDSGNLPSRAGALQAAVNLEIHGLDVDYIDVKLEGLNGQLPNLDMFNLVQRITGREGISSGYKQQPKRKRRSLHDTLKENLANIFEMIISQASGVPNGNHGLCHRYRIESLTLEGVKRSSNNNSNNRLAMLKILEGISRSLNNLLERFHQSYFFYILVQNDRFISIGDFMPCLILIASAAFIKAYLLWTSIDDRNDCINELDQKEVTSNALKTTQPMPFGMVLMYFGLSASIGVLCYFVPISEVVSDYGTKIGLTTASTVSTVLLCFVVLGAILPLMVRLPAGGLELLHTGALVVFGVTLIVLSLLNFSLGFLVAIVSVPLAVLINTNNINAVARIATIFYAFFLNPMSVIYAVVWILTLLQYPELSVGQVTSRAITAAMDAFTFSLVDSLIYGNWLYTFTTAIIFPQWILFWTLSLSLRGSASQQEMDKKTN